jgi:hypothetical protein
MTFSYFSSLVVGADAVGEEAVGECEVEDSECEVEASECEVEASECEVDIFAEVLDRYLDCN